MKHVSQYVRLERDSQTSIGGRSEPAADSSGDEDALAGFDLPDDMLATVPPNLRRVAASLGLSA